MEFKWQKIDFRVEFTPIARESGFFQHKALVYVKDASIKSAIETALKTPPELNGMEFTAIQIMTSEGWENLPDSELDIVFQVSESELQPLECLSKALPLLRSVLVGRRELPVNCSFSGSDRFFSVRIEKFEDAFLVRLESQPRESRSVEIERKILAHEKFDSDRLKIFDDYSGAIWDSTAVEVRDRVDCEIKAIFDRLLEQNISVNDAFTMLSLAVFDARLDAVLDRQYREVSE